MKTLHYLRAPLSDLRLRVFKEMRGCKQSVSISWRQRMILHGEHVRVHYTMWEQYIVNALIHHFLACQHLFENILLNLMFNLQ